MSIRFPILVSPLHVRPARGDSDVDVLLADWILFGMKTDLQLELPHLVETELCARGREFAGMVVE